MLVNVRKILEKPKFLNKCKQQNQFCSNNVIHAYHYLLELRLVVLLNIYVLMSTVWSIRVNIAEIGNTLKWHAYVKMAWFKTVFAHSLLTRNGTVINPELFLVSPILSSLAVAGALYISYLPGVLATAGCFMSLHNISSCF